MHPEVNDEELVAYSAHYLLRKVSGLLIEIAGHGFVADGFERNAASAAPRGVGHERLGWFA
jgi:hypothetical protein